MAIEIRWSGVEKIYGPGLRLGTLYVSRTCGQCNPQPNLESASVARLTVAFLMCLLIVSNPDHRASGVNEHAPIDVMK